MRASVGALCRSGGLGRLCFKDERLIGRDWRGDFRSGGENEGRRRGRGALAAGVGGAGS